MAALPHEPGGRAYVEYGRIAFAIHHEIAGKPQRAPLAKRSQFRVADPLQIDDMSQPKNAPDHLGGGKTECVQIKPPHGPLPLFLERFPAF